METLNIATAIKVLLNMVNVSRAVILVVVSLLVLMLTYSSSNRVLTVKNPSPRDVCNSFSTGTCECTNDVETLSATCCVLQGTETPGGFVHLCETCSINTDTGDYYNCSVYRKSPTTGQANVPKGGGVLEQPKHPKHGGATLPKGGGTIEQPQSSNHSPKDNTKDNTGSVEQQPSTSNDIKGGGTIGGNTGTQTNTQGQGG